MKYKEGDVIKGVVTGVFDYGAFVKFDDGYTGLVHISEISDGFVRDVSDFLKISDVVDVRILECFNGSKRFRLSVKGLNGFGNNRSLCLRENGKGFYYLKRSLPFWIESKVEEMKKSLKK